MRHAGEGVDRHHESGLLVQDSNRSLCFPLFPPLRVRPLTNKRPKILLPATIPSSGIQLREKMSLHPDPLQEITPPQQILPSVLQTRADTKKQSLFYRNALASVKALSARDRETARLLNNLALVLRSQAKYGEAEALYRKALQVHQTCWEPNTSTWLPYFTIWVRYAGIRENLREAHTLLEEALSIREGSLACRSPGSGLQL